MSYQIFARKFRPQSFDEVVGQEHVTTTLKNAIRKNRIAQSFLFSGSRGVGKTSTARILAKALNCAKGVSESSCGKCTSCEEITNGTSLDVLEIDGASNRGIDEIRTLRENVKFKPSSGRFKIYIIDEVHMLTGEAFNALLKTLEEPPEHVKFIFATTESHKVPLTILSRCQRFHFRRLSTTDIHAKLKEIAKKEKIKASDRVLYLIAKSAEGSLRDGEGLLDQLASFGEGEIKEEDILLSLGLASDEVYFEFLRAIEARDSAKVLERVHELSEQGKDLEQFLKGLLERFRDLLVLTLGETKEAWVEQDEETVKELKTLSQKFSREELFLILSLLQQVLRDIKWSRTPRFLVEICLLKIVNRANLVVLADVLSELKKSQPSSSVPQSPQRPISSVPLSREPVRAQTPVIPAESKKKEFREPTIGKTGPQSAKTVETVQETTEVLDSKPVNLTDVERVWPDLLAQVKAKRMSIGMFLSEAEPIEVTNNLVVFGFPVEFKFHKETIEQQNNKMFVRDMLRAILKSKMDITFVVTEPDQSEQAAPTQPLANTGVDPDIVSSVLDIFDGSRVIRKT